jgi:arylsulfatase A-like enzyme
MADKQPNVLILVLDTARARNISSYGYSRTPTPNLDSIASEGVIYKNAVTNAPWTLPAHASLFTGRLPFAHGAHAKGLSLDPELPTLAGLLRRSGYETSIVSSNGWLSKGFGVCRGFENVYEMWKLLQTDSNIVDPYREYVKNEALLSNPGKLLSFGKRVLEQGNPAQDLVNLLYGAYTNDEYHHSGARITNVVKDRIQSDQPFFIVANLLEPHLKYSPPEQYRAKFLPDDVSWEEAQAVTQDPYEVQFGDAELSARDRQILESLYNGELAHVDQYVNTIYEELKAVNELEDTLLIILGDHGENIGDAGMLGHNASLSESALRVPLIIRPPGGDDREVSRYVQLTDIYRTVLEATNCTPVSENTAPDAFSYDILAPDLGGRPDVALAQYAGLQLDTDRIEQQYPDTDIAWYDSHLQSVTAGNHKLIKREVGEDQLYDLEDDPEESHNRLTDMPHRAEELEAKLSRLGGEITELTTQERDIEHGVKHRLQDLGYL